MVHISEIGLLSDGLPAVLLSVAFTSDALYLPDRHADMDAGIGLMYFRIRVDSDSVLSTAARASFGVPVRRTGLRTTVRESDDGGISRPFCC